MERAERIGIAKEISPDGEFRPGTGRSALVTCGWGYFPERYDDPTSTCEACEVADMIALGVKLSQAGTGDYWDDVDRYLRNHFCEMQLTDPAWIYETVEHLKAAPLRPLMTESPRIMAERQGFEPWEELYAPQRFSKPSLSTTQPPLRLVVSPCCRQ